jgi:hypothetical protein
LPTFSASASALNVLLLSAAVLFGVYFIVFVRLIARHPADAAIVKADARGKRDNLLLAPLFVAAMFARWPYDAMAIGAGLTLVLWLGWVQNGRWVRAGATPAFLRRLNAISCLAWIGVLCLGAALQLDRWQGAGAS